MGKACWQGCDRGVLVDGPRPPTLWPPPRACRPYPRQSAPSPESNLLPLAGKDGLVNHISLFKGYHLPNRIIPYQTIPYHTGTFPQDWALGAMYTKITVALTFMGPDWWLKESIEQLYQDGIRSNSWIVSKIHMFVSGT